jgi:sulfate transport system ATP-binding protein
VRPHELHIVERPGPDTFAATLSQVLTVGPRTRIEFTLVDDGASVDVEMSRAEFSALRERLGLHAGSAVLLQAQRLTHFAEAAPVAA